MMGGRLSRRHHGMVNERVLHSVPQAPMKGIEPPALTGGSVFLLSIQDAISHGST